MPTFSILALVDPPCTRSYLPSACKIRWSSSWSVDLPSGSWDYRRSFRQRCQVRAIAAGFHGILRQSLVPQVRQIRDISSWPCSPLHAIAPTGHIYPAKSAFGKFDFPRQSSGKTWLVEVNSEQSLLRLDLCEVYKRSTIFTGRSHDRDYLRRPVFSYPHLCGAFSG